MASTRANLSDTTTSTDWISAIPVCLGLSDMDISEIIKNEKRKQKRIDRIAWKAEVAQRFAKGRHFK